MRKIVIGQIIRDGKVMGTGFLVEPDIVMTVKHNVVTADELITDEFEEKEIMFRMEVGDEVVGKTINLLEAIKKGIDCVFIRLNEVLSEAEMYELIDVKNEIAGVGCHTGIQCQTPAKKYKLYKSSINKSIHFVQRSLSSSPREQRG